MRLFASAKRWCFKRLAVQSGQCRTACFADATPSPISSPFREQSTCILQLFVHLSQNIILRWTNHKKDVSLKQKIETLTLTFISMKSSNNDESSNNNDLHEFKRELQLHSFSYKGVLKLSNKKRYLSCPTVLYSSSLSKVVPKICALYVSKDVHLHRTEQVFDGKSLQLI